MSQSPDRAPPHQLTASEMRRQMAAGRLTATRVIASLAEAMPDLDGDVEAWIHLDLDAASAAAAAADAAGRRGTLGGVPFGAKDNIDTHDLPTAYGTAIYTGCRPSRDASCVAAMRLAGAVLVGKTVSTEFAHRHPGKTRNPWNPAHTPGGSSSGSAAAVGRGMVPIAFGTQTTGSVIRPAAYCGAIGYKPTYGEFNTCGVLPNTPDFDTIGTMTRNLDDIVLVRRALLDDSMPDITPADLAGLRVGICRTPAWDSARPEAHAVVEDAARDLEAAGALVSDFPEAAVFDGLADANLAVSGYEFARSLAYERLEHLDKLSPVLRDGRMADGLRYQHADYVAGRRRLGGLRAVMDEAMAGFDCLITPPAPGAAPPGLDATGPATFNMPWTTLHVPALTLPVAATGDGLPVGLQVVGARFEDARLLDCAAAILGRLGHWRAGLAY